MKREVNGFTLIESLIALLVLSFGLLGAAAMQLKAMQGAHVAYQRSLATVIASDANERLWTALAVSGGACPDDSGIQEPWRFHWADALPGVNVSTIAEQSDCEYLITVTWDDERFVDESDISRLIYFTQLPEKASP